jgi:hypothetical protein
MATAERQARIVRQGPLQAGSGQLEFVSGGIGSYPVTWASRVERPDGRTSPEELLAASHAACYAMALNATLAGANPPQRLVVTATVSLDPRKEAGSRSPARRWRRRAWCPVWTRPGSRRSPSRRSSTPARFPTPSATTRESR